MATNTTRRTFQHKETISINREQFKKVVYNDSLSKKELRVFLHLMTFLDGYNYKEISKKNIAEDLQMSKDDVDNALKELGFEQIIEKGSSEHTEKGYKFTF